jgi:hypothetical protein
MRKQDGIANIISAGSRGYRMDGLGEGALFWFYAWQFCVRQRASMVCYNVCHSRRERDSLIVVCISGRRQKITPYFCVEKARKK